MLIAEDDERQAELLRQYLRAAGHRVAVVHDGRSAPAARQRPPESVTLAAMGGVIGTLLGLVASAGYAGYHQCTYVAVIRGGPNGLTVHPPRQRWRWRRRLRSALTPSFTCQLTLRSACRTPATSSASRRVFGSRRPWSALIKYLV